MTSLDIQKTQANTPQENEVEKYMEEVRQDILEVINTIETNKIKVIKNKNNSGLKDRLKQENKKVLSKDSSLHSNFKSLLQAFLQNPKYSKLFPEFSGEEGKSKLNKKLNRYFPIYKGFLIEKVKQNPGNEKNIILDFVKTLFIFEENLEIDNFGSFFLNNNTEEINTLFNGTKKLFSNFLKVNYHNLENSENNEFNKKTIDLSKQNENGGLMMIKNHISDGVKEDGKIDKQKISISLNSHYKKTAERFIETFEHWYKSTTIDKEFLFILKNSLNNLEKDYEVLKNFGYLSSCRNFFNNYLSNILGSGKYNKNFVNLIGKLIKSDNNNISSVIDEIRKELYENRNKYIRNYVREYKSLENIDLENVDLETWYKGAGFERRSKFFKDAFIQDKSGNIRLINRYLNFLGINPDKNGNFNIDNLLHKGSIQRERLENFLKLDKNFKKQIKSLRGKEDEKFGFYVEDTIEQFKDILKYFQNKNFNNKEDEVLSFIEQEKNSVDLLVGFWWENLENEEKEKMIDQDTNKAIYEKYPSHGIKEGIITTLNNTKVNGKGLLEKEGAQIFIAEEGEEPTNSSAWNKESVLKRFFHGYKEGNINLSDFKLDDKNMKDIVDLYIPPRKNKDDNISIFDINHFLQLGLNTCSLLLSGKTHKSNEYLEIIKKLGFKINNKKQIQELKEFLKYLKYLIPSLEGMMDDAKKDKEDLKDIKSVLSKTNPELNERFNIGPDKDADRGFVKMVSKYNGDPREMGDLTRGMVTSENIVSITDDISEFIKIIKYDPSVKQINISESTGNFTEKAPKPSGYRDVVLEVKMKSGNKVEIQFHYKEYLEFKKHGYVLGENFMKKDFVNNPKKFVKFTDEEINKILNEAERNYKGIKLPENFRILCDNPDYFDTNVNWKKIHKSGNLKENGSFISDNKLSSDSLYNLARAMENDKSELSKTLVSKLRKVESIGYDLAGGKTLANELRQSWKKAKAQQSS